MLLTHDPKFQRAVGVDYAQVPRYEALEHHTAENIKAIGRATSSNVERIVQKAGLWCAMQLLDNVTCDIGSRAETALRVEWIYDWRNCRLTVSTEGERIEMPIQSGLLTHDGIMAQSYALERLITRIADHTPITYTHWLYSYDDQAIARRGSDTIDQLLEVGELSAEQLARYNAFRAGRGVESTLDVTRHQTLRVSVSERLG